MKAREIYKITFPYEGQGCGGKKRPVLVFVLTSKKNRFIGLKITKTERKENRVEIINWQEAGLDFKSYVQCDYYSSFEFTNDIEYVGTLNQSDYDKVVLKFNQFYSILD